VSHHALQRLLVRMQFDPRFADEVLRAPDGALERVGLGARERGWLLAVDRRAFAHDPGKRRRALHALISELKASTAIALAETRRIAFLDGFFASQHFHVAVQQRGSLAAAFAEFLLGAGLRTPQLAEVVRVEARLARCRREVEAAGGAALRLPPLPERITHVARAPGVWAGSYSPDALAAIQAAERFLFEAGLVPALALVEDAPPLVLPPPTGRAPIGLGFVPTHTGITLVELEPDLVAAIARAAPRTPVSEIGEALARELCESEILVAA
jgi:hypothetical protein